MNQIVYSDLLDLSRPLPHFYGSPVDAIGSYAAVLGTRPECVWREWEIEGDSGIGGGVEGGRSNPRSERRAA